MLDQRGAALHPVAVVQYSMPSMMRISGLWMWPQTTPHAPRRRASMASERS